MGEELGSSHIDREFEKLAKKKLKKLAHDMGLADRWNFKKMGGEMRADKDFQDSKKMLNMARVRSGEYFTVQVPKVDGVPGVLEGEDILNNELKFNWWVHFYFEISMATNALRDTRTDWCRLFRLELANIFDETILHDRKIMKKGRPENIPGLKKLVHRARDQLTHRGDDKGSRNTDIDVILLSGGLGSSEYIKSKVEEYLKNEFDDGTTSTVPKVHVVTEPQMCICRGLLENRLLEIWRAGKNNGSYGVVQSRRYSRLNPLHLIAKLGNHVYSRGGNRYIKQVRWLIFKVK
jgi:hypothetical protein